MAQFVAITDAMFKAEVLESDQPVLVDFWAEWCAPCKTLAPMLDEVAGDLAGQVKVARVDVDANPTCTASFGVQSLPTLILFKSGRPAARLVGSVARDQLMERLAPHLV